MTLWLRHIALLLLALTAGSAQALEIRDGQWQQGAVIRGSVPPGTAITVDDKPVRVSEEGLFVFGLDRDAPASVTVTVKTPEAEPQVRRFDVKARDYRIQRIEGVPQSTVTPNPEQVARARKEAAMAWKARQKALERTDFMTDFQWPLTGIITGVYGSQRFYNGEPRRPHYGVDIAAPQGTTVVAPAPGVVTLVHDDMFFSGGTLIVDHGQGLSSTFIHLHKILVEEGDEVAQGQAIAQVGATGRATGPHLDWRMNWFDHRVDPTTLVGPMPDPEASAEQSAP
ncbi:M23 family metallopeptidase [Marinimicrobium agarilyticum]|uniref:M23 family metallopeptidase n=1 Tax=Marinimicrobium agarilyticum TaxID=306546 RepID=UPI00040416A9|nr:M23 family metallopeptidase [Marinimicrobium agarilyticum]